MELLTCHNTAKFSFLQVDQGELKLRKVTQDD